jgi:hypothetical protein
VREVGFTCLTLSTTEPSAESGEDMEGPDIEIEMMADIAASGTMTGNTENAKTEIKILDLTTVCMMTMQQPLHSEQRDVMIVETPPHREAIIGRGDHDMIDPDALLAENCFQTVEIGIVAD